MNLQIEAKTCKVRPVLFCFHKEQRNKNVTVFFVPLFRIFVPLSRFCTTVPFFHNRTKTEQCILYQCSVFSYHCSVFALLFRFFHNGTKTEQCILYHCSMFSYQCSVFAPLFRFCTTVFFLHCCSVFPQWDKNGTVYFVPLFRVFVPLFCFCTTVPFFHNGTKTEQCVFVPLFRCFFLHFYSVFPQQNKNGTVFFVPLFRVFVPLFRFCTTVPFFALLFRFSTTEQKRNGVFCTTVPCLFTTVLFFHYCSIFPQIEGTSHSVSQRQRNETFPNRKGNK